MPVSGMGLKIKPLEERPRSELEEIARGLSIDFRSNIKDENLIKKIVSDDKYIQSQTQEKGVKGELVEGKRVHPQLGEYKKVKVYPKDGSDSSLFFSINYYTVEFHPGTVVSLPKKMIKFIKEATEPKHVFDKTQMSPNGNMGMHTTKQVKRFIVESVEDDD